MLNTSGRIVGRISEQHTLTQAMDSPDAELIAIYGRRRVGKTFLIREFFKEHIRFELNGLHNEPMQRQLENFGYAIKTLNPTTVTPPSSWLEAFELLKLSIDNTSLEPQREQGKKQVLFFDEFPWLATQRSGFLAAFENFWNTFASRRTDIMVIICGSAASWMIKKVIGAKGGLHNRTTRRIRLEPFTLCETKAYLEKRNITLDSYQTTQLYMTLGGIPMYLNYIQRGESIAQNIDRLCFQKDGLLREEFDHLYAALFSNHHVHERIVRALAKHAYGLARRNLLAETKLPSGGSTSVALEELEQSGFIIKVDPSRAQSREIFYRLSDEYTLFYLSWIENNRSKGKDIWLQKSQGKHYSSWCGYAFEALCAKHIPQIKTALGISGVETQEYAWSYQPKTSEETGAQIDLVIERKDHCINLCELKFTNDTFTIDKRYARILEQKRRIFQDKTRSRDTLFMTMVTPHGIKKNDYSTHLIDSEVTLSDLFR